MPEQNQQNNGNGESRIRRVLFNEVSLLTSIIAVVIGILLFITRPDSEMRQDIALIRQNISIMRTNELVHIQGSLNDYKDRINTLEDAVARIEALLQQHLETK
jgi:hypothetical protein